VRSLALHLQYPVGHEQLDEVLEAAAVDVVGVTGDRVADLLACDELPELYEVSLAPSRPWLA
jgi:hypothetical protein